MFSRISKKQAQASYFDSLVFSRELVQDPDRVFALSALQEFGYDGEVSCMAHDPLQSLLAVASTSGRITLYGGKGVPKCSWSIKPSQAVKFLIIKTGSPFVIAVDAKATLHMYDFSELDDRAEPSRLFAHSLRSHINCIEYIPGLSHIFLGSQDGSIDAFDTERLMMSPFRIKNLWMDQDELLRRSGVLNAPPKKRIPACTDIKTHPLDSNQLLIAYEGGIALYDISTHSLVRTYEYIVLPGAPGGHGDETEGAFLERRPAVTCLSWRPDGKMFVSGHDDGSLAFWSVEDGDRPVMARTIAKEDINLATSSSLFGDGASGPAAEAGDLREPIFKLAWSSCTSTASTGSKEHFSGTFLTVLGGLMPSDPKGLHILHFPAYAASGSFIGGAQPSQMREALRNSVKPVSSAVVPTETAPEDFVLLTQNPHYGQTSDPYAVLLMTNPDRDLPRIAPHTERGFAAFSFPPASFAATRPSSAPSASGAGSDSSQEVELPLEMQVLGNQAVVLAEPVTIPGFAYRRLQGDGHSSAKSRHYLPLTGGTTKSKGKQSVAKGAHPVHHGLLTVHVDMSVRIWDCTTATPAVLQSFSARDALTDAQLLAYLDGRVVVERASAAWETTELALALSTGEVVVYRFGYARASAVLEREERDQQEHYNASPAVDPTMRTPFSAAAASASAGQLDVEMAAAANSMDIRDNGLTRPVDIGSGFFGRKTKHSSSGLGLGGNARSGASGMQRSGQGQSSGFEVDLNDVSAMSDWTRDGYKPVLSISSPDVAEAGSRITALSLSDAGFLSVAWGERVAIVDLRGPELLFSEGPDAQQHGGVTLLTWTICAEGDLDRERHPRLLVSYADGFTQVLTLSYTLETWIVNTSAATTFEHASARDLLGAFVMDPQGRSLDMTAPMLDECLVEQERQRTTNSGAHLPPAAAGHHNLSTLLVLVSASGINVKANLTGERVFKLDFKEATFGGRGATAATAARIVRKYGMPVLLVTFADGQAVVFSLPGCQAIKTMRLSFERSRMCISSDGRLLQSLSPTLFRLSSVFADDAALSHVHPSPLAASYYDVSRVLPAPPASSYVAAATSAAVSYVSSWFSGSGSGGSSSASAPALDDVLGGPTRPPVRVKLPSSERERERQSLETVPGQPAAAAATLAMGGAPGRPARNRPVPSAPGRPSSSLSAATAGPGAGRQGVHKVEEVEYNAFGVPKKKASTAGAGAEVGVARNELTDALNERGEKLDVLNENLDRASKASLDFVNQARRMAYMQGAKSALGGGAKGALSGLGKMFD